MLELRAFLLFRFLPLFKWCSPDVDGNCTVIYAIVINELANPMSKPVIVVGDRTSHGGVVISGSPFTDVDGKAVARIGDRVTCPQKGHGSVTTIVTGDQTVMLDGSPVARHGDKTACGATLISSQMLTHVDDGGSGSTAVRGAPSASGKVQSGPQSSASLLLANSAANESDEDEVVEQYFEFLDENGSAVDGYRYDLFENELMHTKAGAFIGGKTATVNGDSALRLVAWLVRDGAASV